jgi:hypothetical protein
MSDNSHRPPQLAASFVFIDPDRYPLSTVRTRRAKVAAPPIARPAKLRKALKKAKKKG